MIEYDRYKNVLEGTYLYQRTQAFSNILIDDAVDYITSFNTDFFSDYILDIDLDYINTLKVFDQDLTSFKKLIANSKFITIATEPTFVQSCYAALVLESEDNPEFSEENIDDKIILKKILEIISQ